MGIPITLVHCYEDRGEYEVVVGGVVLVIPKEDMEKFQNSILVSYILNKVIEQQE